MNDNIQMLLGPSMAFSNFLKTKIKEFNNQHSLHHQLAREKGAIQPINLIVTDDEQQWAGGISAEVYWNWLEINDFWLRKDFRKQGLGSRLLQKTEELAREKGATKALLTTFEFQARSFYEAKGYEVVGEIKDYPPGSSYYTMVKSLIE